MSTEMVAVRVLQSLAGPGFAHTPGTLVWMDADLADTYWQMGVVAAPDAPYTDEDVTMFGTNHRGRRPEGRQATATPAGRQATSPPGGRQATATPAGRQADQDPSSDDDPEPDQAIPDKAADVKSWVAGDPVRARAALDHERLRSKPRRSLVASLAALTDQD